MAKYCNIGCEEIGSLCDFCIYYKDDSFDLKSDFEGEGLCTKKNIRVDSSDSCEDDFYCSLLKE